MAVLKFGAIVTEGSGSLGGHTIQHSKGGFQIRNKPIPHGNPSASQTLIRSINQQLQAGWRALTPSQQKIWNDWPVTHGIMNAKGDKHPLSGHSLWMSINYYYYKIAGAFTLDPALPGPPYYGTDLVINNTFESEILPWLPFNGVVLSRVAGSRPGGTGTFVLNCATTIATSGPYRFAIFSSGTLYKIDGWCKPSGFHQILIWIGGTTGPHWSSTSEAIWQHFSFIATADGSSFYLTSSTPDPESFQLDDIFAYKSFP